MNPQKLGIAIAALVTTSVNLFGAAKPATAVTILGLPAFGYSSPLLRFDSDKPSDVTGVSLTGVTGGLIGIDLRPANNLVYGLTDTSVYTIDPFSGATKLVSTLSEPLNSGGGRFGIDFDPVADQLRVVGGGQQNLSINVDTGAITRHERLNFDPRVTLSNPFIDITSAAYTNSDTDPATATTLYTIASGSRLSNQMLFIQNPVDSGTQVGRGSLGPNLYTPMDFDIATIDGANIAFIGGFTGRNMSYVPSNFSLTATNLDTGVGRRLGTIGNGLFPLRGLTVLPKAVPEPTTIAGLAIVTAGLVVSRRKPKKASD